MGLELSQLWEQKFKHSFQNTPNPFCDCSSEAETTAHYLLHCPTYQSARLFLIRLFNYSNNKEDYLITRILL